MNTAATRRAGERSTRRKQAGRAACLALISAMRLLAVTEAL